MPERPIEPPSIIEVTQRRCDGTEVVYEIRRERNEPPFDCPDAECPGECVWKDEPVGLRPDWCHHVTDRMRDARRAGLLSGWIADEEGDTR